MEEKTWEKGEFGDKNGNIRGGRKCGRRPLSRCLFTYISLSIGRPSYAGLDVDLICVIFKSTDIGLRGHCAWHTVAAVQAYH